MIICEFCKKDWKDNSYLIHKVRCSKNPNRIFCGHRKGKKGSNAFLKGTKTSHTLETRQKISEFSRKKTHTPETRKKISEARLRYLDANPDKVPYLLNHSSKESYPEMYFKEALKDVPDIKFQFSIARYVLDIALIDIKLNIEIDGEQHYSDSRIVESDKRRTSYLTELGWTTQRIRWSEFRKLSEEDRLETILKIKNGIQALR